MHRRSRIAIAHFADRAAAQRACEAILPLGLDASDMWIEAEAEDAVPSGAARLTVRLFGPDKIVLRTLLASETLRLEVHDTGDP